MEHSVTLVKDKCKGCTACIKQCPTEAIRVRRGRATIINERCIDCGQCIRVCPHNAKRAVCDSLERLNDFVYTVALPAPALYGQFKMLDGSGDINIVLGGLLKMGFDYVYEVAKGAEMISELTRLSLQEDTPVKPLISSACPAVVRLICTRFPKLIGHITEHIAPMEIAAIQAREEAMERTSLAAEQIGVFFITPCPAKVTTIHAPCHLNQPVIDGAFSMAEVSKVLLRCMQQENPQLAQSGKLGLKWSISGGESAALADDNYLAVSGIEHVIDILEDVEDGRIADVRFLELNACNQGCVGGCLTVESPYVAKSRIKRLAAGESLPLVMPTADYLQQSKFLADKSLEGRPVWQLSEDLSVALELYKKISNLMEILPGLNCGACGTPSCRALAEDIVLGFASEEDCVFRMREKMQEIAGGGNADEYLPPPFRKSKDTKNKFLPE